MDSNQEQTAWRLQDMRSLRLLEEFIEESLDPQALREKFGLLHPLSKFAASATVKEGPCADAILAFIHGLTWDEPDRGMHKAAIWFLFESEHAYFVVCAEAGIDAEKLRSHLLGCRRFGR